MAVEPGPGDAWARETAPKFTALPSRQIWSRALWAATTAARCLLALAFARLSAAIFGALFFVYRLQSGDDALQVGLDMAQVLGQAELALGVGLGDQAPVGGGLAEVDF